VKEHLLLLRPGKEVIGMKHLSYSNPVLVSLGLVAIAFLLRILDLLVIRSDEILGEQVVNKVVGLVLILAYVWSVKQDFGSIGLHARNWRTTVLWGAVAMGVGLVIGYGAEWLYLYATGSEPRLILGVQSHPLITEDAAAGGILLVLTLLIGNVINSFMEEGLFRGVLITHLGSRMNMGRANLIQAVLFGVWHIVLPLRDYLDGQTSMLSALTISAGYILLSGLIGFAWGYFYQKTDSLWMCWTAHMLNNTTFNFLQISTVAGIPGTLGLRVGVTALVVAVSLPMVKKIAAERGMPEVTAWV
jgi:membrane protease YdiL (CAAX protease family)